MESGGIRPPSAAPAAAAPQQLTPEEAALKRNTDCVYFLASPLTCKKGSECEYRHSEGARVNPRDCHYWMYGNCTNRKCAYRHPPLDGLFGAPPTPAASVGPQAIGPQATAYNPTKLSVPCHYFRKGNCIKGDRCPFMHGPPLSATNAIPQQPAKVSASPVALFGTTQRKEPSNPSTIAKPAQNNPSFGANNTKNTQEKQVFNPSKPVLNSSGPNGAAPAIPKPRADFTVNNNTHQLDNLPVEDHPKFAQNQYPSGRGTPVQNRDRSDERPEDSREGDEFLGESSPGFDVIVDHDEEGSGYLPQNEEDFRRAFADPYDPAEMYPLDDYEPMSRYERDRHGVMPEREYEPEFNHEADCFGYKGGNDQFDRKRPRRDSSSERALDRPSRRPSHREEVGVVAESRIEGSDLRHRLMNKHKMPNGSRSSRSDVSSDKRDDRRHRHSNRRDEKYPEERDRHRSRGTEHRSNRLQGRIKMPLRPAERSDLMHEDIIEMERRRHMRGIVRVSPVPVDFPSRHHRERIGRLSSDREFVGRPPASRRDDVGFAGPKSLSELKKSVKGTDKVSEGGGRVVKEKSAINFEGPKPLSVILKRKREAAGVPSGNGSSSENKEAPVNNAVIVEHEEVEEGMIPDDGNGTDYEVQDVSKIVGTNEEEEFQEDGEMEEPYDETAQGEDLNYYEGEEGEEYKMDDDSAYQKEGEEANEYPEGEEVFEEDDDDDDEQAFARKVGVLFS